MIQAADLATLYPAPDPNANQEAFDRYHCQDLRNLLDPDLKRELGVLRFLNWFLDDRDAEWRRFREDKVADELAARYRRRASR